MVGGGSDPARVFSGLGRWARRYRRHTTTILTRRPRDLDIYAEAIATVVRDGDRVLHLGCGWDRNNVSHPLQSRCRIVGLDADPRAIEHFHGEAWEARAEQLPFADATFDVVLCEYVLEHLERPQQVIAEVARVLRIGGSFVALAPNRWSYKSIIAASTPHAVHVWAATRLRPDHRSSEDVYPTRYRMNSRSAVHQSAALHGFRVERFAYLNNGPTWFQHIPVLFEAGRVVHWAMDRVPALRPLQCGFIVVMKRWSPGLERDMPRAEGQQGVRCLSCGSSGMEQRTDGFHCPRCGHVYPRRGHRIIARS